MASGAFQSVILVLPMLGLVLTFVRLGGRAGRGIWRKTEGKPIGRLVAMGGMAAVVGALAYTWLPNGDYEPIRKGERGTLTEGIAAIAQAPTGRPSLVSEQRAADEGRLVVPPGEDVPVSTTSTTPTTPTTPTTAVPGPATTAVPSGQTPDTTVAPNRSGTTVPPTTVATTEPPTTTTTTVRRTTTTATL